jgi:hypothetical protein
MKAIQRRLLASKFRPSVAQRASDRLEGALGVEASSGHLRIARRRPAGPGDRPEFVGNVSDALLRLLALRENASRREEGPRRHESPWQTLGLVDKEDARGWVELLLDTLPDE